MSAFADCSVVISAIVVSDGRWCFGLREIVGVDHERVVTGGGKSRTKLLQFKAILTFVGNLRRSLCGTYDAFDFAKYAHCYLAEDQCRFNLRSILALMLRAACLSNPYKRTLFVWLRLIANQVCGYQRGSCPDHAAPRNAPQRAVIV